MEPVQRVSRGFMMGRHEQTMAKPAWRVAHSSAGPETGVWPPGLYARVTLTTPVMMTL